MGSVYKCQMSHEETEVCEAMRQKIADSKLFGVTLQGNRLTLRWYEKEQLVDVHMIIESVTTPSEAADHLRRCEELREISNKVSKKFPDFEAEMFHAYEGEWPK